MHSPVQTSLFMDTYEGELICSSREIQSHKLDGLSVNTFFKQNNLNTVPVVRHYFQGRVRHVLY